MKSKYYLLALFLFIIPVFSFAQADRSYIIDSFDANVGINKDSTVDIIEKISYTFSGEYHKGFRSISKKDVSNITDIYVVDSSTGQKLDYSFFPLEKTDPKNWGKYAVVHRSGYTDIEWYYDEKNSSHAWEIHYTIHGLVGFYEDFDEVYLNLFTEYDVPISSVTARIKFIDILDPKTTRLAWYRSYQNEGGSFFSDNDGYFFSASDIKPQEAVTVAIGFPKELIAEKHFWYDFLKTNWGYVFTFFLVIFTIIFCFICWYKNEYLPRHNASIITQFEPPHGLKPGQLDIIYNEKITKKSWVSTIVDLAVKGYVEIAEDKEGHNNLVFQKALSFLVFIIMTVIIFLYVTVEALSDTFDFQLLIALLLIAVFVFKSSILFTKEYKIYLTKSKYQDDEKLDTYEKAFLKALFGSDGIFSTRELKNSPYRSRELYVQMQRIEQSFLEEVGRDFPEMYTTPVKNSFIRNVVLVLLPLFCVFFTVVLFSSIDGLSNFSSQVLAIFYGVVIFSGSYLYFVKYNPKLSNVGNETWKNIQGFKNYLGVAEKYRMQNLTPEIFEKYLPYAIVFGIEKKWAKNFDSIVTKPPNWYVGSYMAGGALSSSNFSISTFSSSFSNSFSTSFSSAGGSGSSGGGSGGGGGAGGGGGGGGGGAS